ncbi:MAG: redox-sensitive transcriptional activator SoxR [Propionibacteriales bacterium]|nr:redox-sensitive transcriptional activator SoxR [Propionibacteriales bacterium]
MSKLPQKITIGELSVRSGVPASALRFYEAEGLLQSTRTTGNQRRFDRSQLRRVAFIRSAQRVGLSIQEIRDALATLPDGRTPNKADWQRLSRNWEARLDEQIERIQRLKTRLTACIGCGCLSLKTCSLSNTDDLLAEQGAGAYYLQPGKR